MMPLWTTATRSVACGWALSSVGRPCVAQRVWPMPIVPPSGSRSRRSSSVRELAFGAPAAEHAFLQRGDAGRVVAAVFEPLERVDQLARDRPVPQNSDDSAHPPGWPLCPLAYGLAAAAKPEEITTHFAV